MSGVGHRAQDVPSYLPRVAVVTTAHNGVAKTIRFLETAERLDGARVITVLVDDGSTDGTATAIAARFPQVTVLPGDGRLWWSGATNLGVAWARAQGADFVFTINSDTTLHPDVLSQLVTTALANPRSVVGAKVLVADDPDDVWFFGARFDLETSDVRHIRGRAAEFESVEEAEALTGMGMLVPMDAFDEVGVFDAAKLPQYFADMDFSLRARAAGFRLLVDPGAVVYCDTGSSWIAQAQEMPMARFLFRLLLSKRSPENVLHRVRFYRRHWPTSVARPLAHHYGSVLRHELSRGYRRRRPRSGRPGML